MPPQATRILQGGVTQQNEIQLPPEDNLVLHLLDAMHTRVPPLSSLSFISQGCFFNPSPQGQHPEKPGSPARTPQITSSARTPIIVLVITKGASSLAVPKPCGFRCLKMHRTVAMAFRGLLNGTLTLMLKARAAEL